MLQKSTRGGIVVGLDSHADTHAAVAIAHLGRKLGEMDGPATREGYRKLHAWAVGWAEVDSYGIEGTGSYGAGLTR